MGGELRENDFLSQVKSSSRTFRSQALIPPLRPTDCLRPSSYTPGNGGEEGPAHHRANSRGRSEIKSQLSPQMRAQALPTSRCQICLQKRKTKGAVFLPTWFQISNLSEVFLVRQKARGRLEEGPCFSRGPEVSGKCDTRKCICTE